MKFRREASEIMDGFWPFLRRHAQPARLPMGRNHDNALGLADRLPQRAPGIRIGTAQGVHRRTVTKEDSRLTHGLIVPAAPIAPITVTELVRRIIHTRGRRASCSYLKRRLPPKLHQIPATGDLASARTAFRPL
ncbi:hypothetical protein D3C72_960630 [compost metagenome]